MIAYVCPAVLLRESRFGNAPLCSTTQSDSTLLESAVGGERWWNAVLLHSVTKYPAFPTISCHRRALFAMSLGFLSVLYFQFLFLFCKSHGSIKS